MAANLGTSPSVVRLALAAAGSWKEVGFRAHAQPLPLAPRRGAATTVEGKSRPAATIRVEKASIFAMCLLSERKGFEKKERWGRARGGRPGFELPGSESVRGVSRSGQ
jgi:hypothetical protein